MRAPITIIVIQPDKTVSEREVSSLAEMQSIVDGCIEPIDLKDGSTMWCNDEFLYHFTSPDQVNWVASDVCSLGGRPDMLIRPLLGPCFLSGGCDAAGNTLSVTDQGRRWVHRVGKEAGAVFT